MQGAKSRRLYPWAASIVLGAVKYCNHGNSGWTICLCGVCETLALVHLLPMELCTQEPAVALAKPAGCSSVSRLRGRAGPLSSVLKGTLVFLSSWAGRRFMRLSVKNHLQ